LRQGRAGRDDPDTFFGILVFLWMNSLGENRPKRWPDIVALREPGQLN
jgi:hypothetical protein